ncbi:NifU family protein [Mycobacterium shigaense]|uniref:Uncharacterized protein n=1 Tax=Mycobacterium shigaense TaxID=722731 RepID=A0A1Z4EFR0_9MYCO|nr:NifU family protein [Mycobacterium shigaense]MEA1124375.1 NifU family protein [Mycobacterium shigaense]PRI16514.1 hypothetical protein B2J96_07030 [Mycobacterium shigaense]BAX91792.1 hypothetical protein MSG_01638 [Mycobacterium shigaense]
MTPLHAVATADPRQLRWVVAADRLPPRGTVRHAPGRLGALLDAGVLDEIVVGATDIAITVGPSGSWRAVGDDVRDALGAALLDPAGWVLDGPDLKTVAAELLSGSVGALAASHGGSIELVSVAGHTVTVRMSGACDGCPAATSTLRDVFERELRRTDPAAVVSCENDSAAISLGKKLLSLIVR